MRESWERENEKANVIFSIGDLGKGSSLYYSCNFSLSLKLFQNKIDIRVHL